MPQSAGSSAKTYDIVGIVPVYVRAKEETSGTTTQVRNHLDFVILWNGKMIRNDFRPMFNHLIRDNDQQREAVKNIVNNTAFPAPYIIYGPPGTGKTATMVEAITQVCNY